ncbi:MAG: NAD-dependent epimerase/dehydratase family protein [Bryobacteraceae bacterium]
MTFDDSSLVLVTGGSGLVGSHLVDRLLALGARVRCIVRPSSSLRWLPVPRIELMTADLATGDGLAEALRGVSAVFHSAGVTKANSAEEYYRGNLLGTENLLRACEARGGALPRFIHVSSLAAIGPSASGLPLSEDAEPRPLTHYGRSKLAGETAVRGSRLGPEAVIVRPPAVYGPRDTDMFKLLRAASSGWLVRIGRQESYASLIYVKDLADALIAAASCDAAQGRTYFTGDPEPVSWTEFASIAARLAGRELRTVSVPPALAYCVGLAGEIQSRWRGKPGIVSREKIKEAKCRYWICDTTRARKELGFTPRHTLEQGIAESLAWYKEAGWIKA